MRFHLQRKDQVVSMVYLNAGHWLVTKYRKLAAEVGVQQAARNMRKQGAPLDVALAVLVGRV